MINFAKMIQNLVPKFSKVTKHFVISPEADTHFWPKMAEIHTFVIKKFKILKRKFLGSIFCKIFKKINVMGEKIGLFYGLFAKFVWLKTFPRFEKKRNNGWIYCMIVGSGNLQKRTRKMTNFVAEMFQNSFIVWKCVKIPTLPQGIGQIFVENGKNSTFLEKILQKQDFWHYFITKIFFATFFIKFLEIEKFYKKFENP